MKKVVGYARIGSAGVIKGTIEEQEALIKATVTNNPEWELIDLYADIGTTGKGKKRVSFEKMLQDAEAHKFEVIVVQQMERLTRNLAEAQRVFTLLYKLGIEVYFIANGMSSNDKEFKSEFEIWCGKR